MKAAVFHDICDIRSDEVAEPGIRERTEAIVRITASATCGTDPHMIRRALPGLKPGTVLGHEGLG
jgi:threonine dehydrogenase-like Zn-dependent dehydrogenase